MIRNDFFILMTVGFYWWACLPATAVASLDSPGPAHPGKVVILEDAQATAAFQVRPDRVRAMVERGVSSVTGHSKAADAWRSLVSGEETVGIKVFSAPGGTSGTRLEVVAAVIEGLLESGISKEQIVIWDKRLAHLHQAGFDGLVRRYGVRLAGSQDAGFDAENYYEPEMPVAGRLVWGDYEFGRSGLNAGRRSYLSKLLTEEITKIIQVTPLLNHNWAGVTGNLYSLALGSVDNTLRFETDPAGLAMALPEIYAIREVGDRVVLNITDALICQYLGGERPLLHYSSVLNQLWFSQDPVALDVLALHELDRQRQNAKVPSRKPNLQIYSNAALLQLGVDDPREIRILKIK